MLCHDSIQFALFRTDSFGLENGLKAVLRITSNIRNKSLCMYYKVCAANFMHQNNVRELTLHKAEIRPLPFRKDSRRAATK